MASHFTKPPKPRHTTIKIKKDKDEPQGFKFDFKEGLFGKTQKQTYDNDGHPGFLIRFTIDEDDAIETGLRFPKIAHDALWVHQVQSEDGPCPPRGARWPEFNPEEVIDEGRTLVVRNHNRCYDLFRFSLNFTRDRDNPNEEPVCWDPIGINRNGMFAFARADYAHVGTVAVAGVALGALATVAFLNRKGRH